MLIKAYSGHTGINAIQVQLTFLPNRFVYIFLLTLYGTYQLPFEDSISEGTRG